MTYQSLASSGIDASAFLITDTHIVIKKPSAATPRDMTGDYALYGAGIPGFALAAFCAFSAGQDVRFVRPAAKGHGLKLQIEGPPAPPHTTPLVVMIGEHLMMPPSLAGAEFISHVPDSWEHRPSPRQVHTDLDVIERHLTTKAGDFLLSSGARGALYVDAIPALTIYDSAMALAEYLQPFSDVDLIVAPAYGGVALAVALGLRYRIDVIIPTNASLMANSQLTSDICHSRARVLIVDDYTSTGGTLERLFGPLLEMQHTKIFSLCVGPHAGLEDADLHWLFRFDGAALSRSPSGAFGITPAGTFNI